MERKQGVSRMGVRSAWRGFAVVLGAIGVTSAGARDAVAQEARADEEAAVRAAVEQIFEGMRASDADLVRDVFAPDARFAVVDTSEGAARVGAQPVDGWLQALAASERRWDERLYDVEVRVDGAMASVWAPYTFYLDGAVRHCGINSIELLRDADGWKVTQISDTRRTGTCPDPLGGNGR